MTEVTFNFQARKGRNSRSVQENDLPELNSDERIKTEGPKQVKQLSLHRNKTQVVNPYLLRSNREWQRKEDACVQQAIHKIDKIMKARSKVVEKFRENVKHSKEVRKEKIGKLRLNYQHNSLSVPSSREQRHKAVESRSIKVNKKSAGLSTHNSDVQLRHERKLEEEFEQRDEMFGMEKFRERRGRFHKMVQDAVSVFRLEALRPKS